MHGFDCTLSTLPFYHKKYLDISLSDDTDSNAPLSYIYYSSQHPSYNVNI